MSSNIPSPTQTKRVLELIAQVGPYVQTANGILDLVDKVRTLLREPDAKPKETETGLRAPRPGPFAQFRRSLQPPLLTRRVVEGPGPAAHPPGPISTHGFLGMNLTGRWVFPQTPSHQCEIHQFGPLVVLRGAGDFAGFAGDGLVYPPSGVLYLAGGVASGLGLSGELRLMPDGALFGSLSRSWPGGAHDQVSMHLVRTV